VLACVLMEIYGVYMERRLVTESISRNIRDSINSANTTVESVAKAAAATTSSIDGSKELSLDELVAVGGFFRVCPAIFFEGVTA
jgi:hypothetical protein